MTKKIYPEKVLIRKNVVIQGDSFDVLPQLSSKGFDHIITDVPYDLDDNAKRFLHDEFNRLAKQWIIVFSPPENQWIFPDLGQILFWVKPISTKNTSKSYSRFVEMIFVYGNSDNHTWNTNRHWSQYTNVFTDLVMSKEHSYKKPYSLIERLILNHTKSGDTILDPFAGSGTTIDVAMQHGRIGYGIDNDPDFGSQIFVYDIS